MNAPTLGSHLRDMREARDLSQAALADMVARYVGMQQWIIGRWERDTLRPDAGQLEALLDALDASEADRATARRLARDHRLRPQPLPEAVGGMAP